MKKRGSVGGRSVLRRLGLARFGGVGWKEDVQQLCGRLAPGGRESVI